MKTKVCKICGLEYDLEEFPLNGRTATGKPSRRPECRDCRNAKKRAYHDANKEDQNAKRKARYYRDPWRRKLQAVYGTRRDAPGILDVSDLKKVWADAGGRCEYCGKTVEWDNPESWTFDHAEPLHKGGTHDPENMRVACVNCNRKKGIKTESEFRFAETGVPF